MLDNFKAEELFSEEAYDKLYPILGENIKLLLDYRLRNTIHSLRDFLGIPMIINTWSFTTDKYGRFQNRCFRMPNVGVGALQGSHYKGMGVDFDCYENGIRLSPDYLRKLILKNIDKFPYIRCCETDINWCHFDIMDMEDSYRRNGIDATNILLWSPNTGSKVVSREELKRSINI